MWWNLVYTADLKSAAFGIGGSSPSIATMVMWWNLVYTMVLETIAERIGGSSPSMTTILGELAESGLLRFPAKEVGVKAPRVQIPHSPPF